MEENSQLRNQLTELRNAIAEKGVGTADLASGDDTFEVHLALPDKAKTTIQPSWNSMFLALGPHLMSECRERTLYAYLCRAAATEFLSRAKRPSDEAATSAFPVQVLPDDFRKIIYQFIALEYIEPVTMVSQQASGDRSETHRSQGYKLTPHGVRTLSLKQAIRKKGP